MLRKVPQVLQDVYGRRLRASTVRVGDWPAYLRWLQFYLNFCDKYRHPPRDPDSLQPFLQKLAAKNQTLAEQQQAADEAAVEFLQAVERLRPTGHGQQPAQQVKNTGREGDAGKAVQDRGDRGQLRLVDLQMR